jgi:hypothetical protein
MSYALPNLSYALPNLSYTLPNLSFALPNLSYVLPNLCYALPNQSYAWPNLSYAFTPCLIWATPCLIWAMHRLIWATPCLIWAMRCLIGAKPCLIWATPRFLLLFTFQASFISEMRHPVTFMHWVDNASEIMFNFYCEASMLFMPKLGVSGVTVSSKISSFKIEYLPKFKTSFKTCSYFQLRVF